MANLRSTIAGGALALVASAASAQQPAPPPLRPPSPMPAALQTYKPVTADRLKQPDDGDWLMYPPHLRRLGLQPAGADHDRERRPAEAGMDPGDRPGRGPPGAADRQQRRDVRRDAGEPGAWPSTPRPATCCGGSSGRSRRTCCFSIRPAAASGCSATRCIFAAADAVLVALDAKTGRRGVDDQGRGLHARATT